MLKVLPKILMLKKILCKRELNTCFYDLDRRYFRNRMEWMFSRLEWDYISGSLEKVSFCRIDGRNRRDSWRVNYVQFWGVNGRSMTNAFSRLHGILIVIYRGTDRINRSVRSPPGAWADSTRRGWFLNVSGAPPGARLRLRSHNRHILSDYEVDSAG